VGGMRNFSFPTKHACARINLISGEGTLFGEPTAAARAA
jgi:hypothetical protein